MNPRIELSGAAFGYGSFNVLEKIELHLHPGPFVGLAGPNRNPIPMDSGKRRRIQWRADCPIMTARMAVLDLPRPLKESYL